MSDLSTPSNVSWDQINPGDLEARLNSLGSDSAPASHDDAQNPSLLDQFLSDPELAFLGSRSSEVNEAGEPFETVTEYHRISLDASQSRVILHLAFRPDLTQTPAVEVNLIDSEGRIRITHNTRFGSRIEISLVDAKLAPRTICVEAICTTASETQP